MSTDANRLNEMSSGQPGVKMAEWRGRRKGGIGGRSQLAIPPTSPRPLTREQAQEFYTPPFCPPTHSGSIFHEGGLFYRKPISAALNAILAFLVAMVCVNAGASGISWLARFPGWLSYPLLAINLACLSAVIFLAGRFTRDYFRLNPSVRQVRRASLEQANLPASQRSARIREARAYVQQTFFPAFHNDPERLQKMLNSWGIDEETRRSLEISLQRLRADNGHSMPHDAWLKEYDRFENVMKSVAEKRGRHYGNDVGIKTALSPFRLLDVLAVLGNSILLIRDLAELHGRRPSGLQSGRILLHLLAQVALADQLQESLHDTVEALRDGIEQCGALGGLLPRLAGKVGEGVLNGLFVFRLGKRLNAQLLPMR